MLSGRKGGVGNIGLTADGSGGVCAAESGAELLDGTAAIACEEENGAVWVTLQNRERCKVRARYLLDCEGVTGALKRKLAPGPAQYITTFQTFNEGRIVLDPHYFYAYLQPELSEYDAWFNVKDGFLVLGVSVRDAKRAEYFYRRFLSYMEERHGLCTGREERREKWLMPRIPPGCPIYYGQGRVLCAGEAAGFLNPMGEGVSAALESGHHAAGALMEHWNEPERALARYRERTNAAGLHAASMEFYCRHGGDVPGDEDVRRPPERRMTGKTAMNASKTDGRS